MAAELTLAAIAVLLISAAFSALLLRLGLQRQIKLFETFDAAIVDFERDTWRVAAGRPVVPAEDDDGGDLHGLLATSERRYISAGRPLAAARNSAPCLFPPTTTAGAGCEPDITKIWPPQPTPP